MTSNKEKGDEFRDRVSVYFQNKGYTLKPEYKVEIGFGSLKKIHPFDLGNEQVLIACKKYRWAETGTHRSGMFATLNETMLIFCAAPTKYRKLLFVWKSPKNNKRKSETIVEYYISHHGNLIPNDIEVWEFDETNLTAEKKFPNDPQSVKLGGIWKGTKISEEEIDEN